jgi:acetyl-CoA carboxylase biotin carboxyl carrier protein
MTDAFDQPTDRGVDANAMPGAPDEFTAADLVAAGDALAPDQAIDERSDPAHAGAAKTDETAEAAVPAPAGNVAAESPTPATDIEPGDASLLGLIDRLGAILERSDLTELEVEAGRTTVVLRKPAAVAAPVSVAASAPIAEPQPAATTPSAAGAGRGSASTGGAPARPSVKAPLTGIWYGSPTPGSAPFVEVGRELAVGQVVGLIEAMKLFNEIKSDIAGRVVRVVPDSGTLVKAKQPLIEVDPL